VLLAGEALFSNHVSLFSLLKHKKGREESQRVGNLERCFCKKKRKKKMDREAEDLIYAPSQVDDSFGVCVCVCVAKMER